MGIMSFIVIYRHLWRIRMKINPKIRVYGDLLYRNKSCATESQEQLTLINQVRKHYPDLVFTSVKNEGKRTKQQIDDDKAMGLRTGVSDLIFFGSPTLCLEMKRQDHTLSKWQPEQEPFLIAAQEQGAISCVCFGWQAAMEAVEDWIKLKNS